MEKVTFQFNDQTIEAPKGANLLKAILDAGYEIPHYCYHPGLSVAGSCRLCAVEIGKRDDDGNVVMGPKLAMACKSQVAQDQIVRSDTEKVKKHQKSVMEYLLINHPLDCPVCDQAGECYLQDYSYRYGNSVSRMDDLKVKQAKKDIGKNIVLYSDRCIMCSRCVRFTREIAGTAELCVTTRGNKSEIEIFPGHGVDNKLSGNIVDICPVGAMLDKNFLFKQRVWFLKSAESVCPRCSRGCSIYVDHNQGVVWRIRPRFNGVVNGHWMCDEGRHGFKFTQAEERLTASRIGKGSAGVQVDNTELKKALADHIRKYRQADGGNRLAVVISPDASTEEQWMLAAYARSISDETLLVRGPLFSEEKDEEFKNGFKISKDKAPNEEGMEMVLKHFGGHQISFAELLDNHKVLNVDAAWIQGGYPWLNWCDSDTVTKLRDLNLLIVEDILASELTDQADIVIASRVWTEKDGTFVNDQKMPQCFQKAITAKGQTADVCKLLWQLSDRTRAYSLSEVWDELKEAFPGLAYEAVIMGWKKSNNG